MSREFEGYISGVECWRQGVRRFGFEIQGYHIRDSVSEIISGRHGFMILAGTG